MARPLPAGYVRHPELGTPMPPGSWKLKHTQAEIELVAKAMHHQADLTDADREQLLLLSGPLIGKALCAPSSITDDERRQIIGWPPTEQCAANIAAVGLGDMRPEDIVAETVKDQSWLKTREQAHLVANRFNLRPLDAPKVSGPWSR